ncbi:DUF4132 domain-containing protein [Actinocorallia longicatena]|uniref:DUF4132 domain-containing protein n=1 Tax=Actinocorallia longicatena TaxID=111803 RepID=A0ABP6PWP2_9ACTN
MSAPFPPEWLPVLHPRRGGAVPPVVPGREESGLGCVDAARMVVALEGAGGGGFRHPRFALAVRARIAAADEDVHREVLETLAGLRHRSRAEDTLIAYLAPNETAWVDEVCAGPPVNAHLRSLIHLMVHTPEQTRAPGFEVTWPGDLIDPAKLATLAEGLGEHLAVLLEERLPGLTRVRHRALLFRALSHLPGDRAYRLLLRYHGDREGSAELREATRRFPVRAARLLGDDPSEAARHLLHFHLMAFPELQDDRLRARAGMHGRLPVARPRDLPGLLRASGGPVRMEEWADPGVLPRIRVRGRGAVLPQDAVREVQALLASGRGDAVREAVDRASLAGFGWAQFEAWRAVGMPFSGTWALTCLGRIGDDTTALRLAPIIRDWPGRRCHPQAVEGLGVLEAIGTGTSLRLLAEIAVLARFKVLRRRARERLARAAQGLGLTADQLLDRLVPELGLAADGTVRLDGAVLDFGPFLRTFVPGTRPLPGPASGGPAGERRLEADVRLVAAAEARRLERAMIEHRLWTPEEFRALAAHPLTGPLVRRLVWSCPAGEFRVTGNGAYEDLRGAAVVLSGPVDLPHPLGLAVFAREWCTALAGVPQPFAQLERPVARLSDAERDASHLHRFEGHRVPAGRLLSLKNRGWRSGERRDGLEQWISRPLPGGAHLVVEFAPGIPHAGHRPPQHLTRIRITDRPSPQDGPAPAFGTLDPTAASEVLTDLARLTARPQ